MSPLFSEQKNRVAVTIYGRKARYRSFQISTGLGIVGPVVKLGRQHGIHPVIYGFEALHQSVFSLVTAFLSTIDTDTHDPAGF